MWGVDALLADDVVARMSSAASGALSDTNSTALVQWIQTMLDHVAPVPIAWSLAYAAAADSSSTVAESLSDLVAEVSSLLPAGTLDLNDSDHTGIFHALARAQHLLRTPPERSLVAVFDPATTRCFQELSRNLQAVVQRCVQTDDFTATAAPSVKHSSSAVDVGAPPPHSIAFSIEPPPCLQVCSAVSNVAETWQRLGLPSSDTAARECRRAVAQLLALYCRCFQSPAYPQHRLLIQPAACSDRARRRFRPSCPPSPPSQKPLQAPGLSQASPHARRHRGTANTASFRLLVEPCSCCRR